MGYRFWRLALLPKRPFGSTGIDVSILGLGTVKLGRDQGVKYPNSFTIPDDREAANLIALACDLGINLIDTAPSYGNSEERLGSLLKGQRNQWVICSKVGEEYEGGLSRFDFTPEHTRFSVERSLKRLNTDVIDIVLVHSDGNDEAIIKEYRTLDVLAELKAEGKIRAFGMSTKTIAGGLLAAEQSDGVMVTWNLQYESEVPIIDYCRDHNKGVLIKKALASGHAALGAYEDPVQKSVDMIFSHAGVSSAIVGTINPQHLADNVGKVSR
ncbi:MAG: aryl-alcohol dehydrogenase-like predicted oxidoreductase [Porticoccus sp.]